MPRRRRVQSHLAEVPLFASLSAKELAIVARHTEEVALPVGTPLVEEGEAGDAFFVLLDGEVTVRRRGRKVEGLGPGAWFGELALLDGGPRTATVVAETPVTVGVLGARVFAVLRKEVPTLSDKLLKGMAARLREADAKALQ